MRTDLLELMESQRGSLSRDGGTIERQGDQEEQKVIDYHRRANLAEKRSRGTSLGILSYISHNHVKNNLFQSNGACFISYVSDQHLKSKLLHTTKGTFLPLSYFEGVPRMARLFHLSDELG